MDDLKDLIDYIESARNRQSDLNIPFAESHIVLNALRSMQSRRAEPEPVPLTLEDLKERNGKPVYIVEHPDWGHWELSAYAEDYYEDRDEEFYNMRHDDPDGRYGLHVLGWLAYDREPGSIKPEPPGCEGCICEGGIWGGLGLRGLCADRQRLLQTKGGRK